MHSITPGSHARFREASSSAQWQAQRGVTLVELMVGIAIGLLVIAVAMGALMVSRSVSGSVSDASDIQQQAAYAMRVIGTQIRQSGSVRLNLNPGAVNAAQLYNVKVAFESGVSLETYPALDSFDPKRDIVSGTETPDSLRVGYQRYTEPTFISATEQALARNCVGRPADASTDQRLESIFTLNTATNELRCDGNAAVPQPQPILRNVANFQVRYLVQDNTTSPGISTIRSVDASVVTNWGQVQAVEVCLVLYGRETIDLPAGSTYTDCDGVTQIDMSTLPVDTATVRRRNRMHMTFRTVFQLRSQGLIGTVIF